MLSHTLLSFLLEYQVRNRREFSMDQHQSFPFKRRQKSSTKSTSMGPLLKRKLPTSSLETFLLLWFLHTSLLSWNNKLANVAEIIKLIIRDESVHGTYIGYKFQLGFNELPEEEQENSKSGCMICSTLSMRMKKVHREPL